MSINQIQFKTWLIDMVACAVAFANETVCSKFN